MTKPSVGLICDQPSNSGMGKYGAYLQKHLRDDFDIEIVYFDFHKPWLWGRTINRISDYDLTHIISQNLSFLAPRNRKWLVTCHDVAPLFMPSSPTERWWRRILYSGLKRAGTILTDSEYTRGDLIYTYRIHRDRIKVIPLGVDHSIYKPLIRSECRTEMGIPLGARVVLSVAIDKWRKNSAGLIMATSMLIRDIPDILIVFCGTPSATTLELIRNLNLVGRFLVKSKLSEEKLAMLYNCADVFALPSFYEGFGLPALEAMACGIPVVASNRTAVPEVVGNAGVLVDPDDVAGLARGIRHVLTDHHSYSEYLSRACIKQSSKFTWEATANSTAEVYRDILSNGGLNETTD